MELPRVTAENYFSPEIQMAYMSVSQYKDFRRCEAAGLAAARGEYVRPPSAAQLVGSYIDAWFSGTMDRFREENPQLFKANGALKAAYVRAEEIALRMMKDELLQLLLSGQKQVIHTGEIAGVPFKIKVDCQLGAAEVRRIMECRPSTRPYFGLGDGALVDLKIMRDMAPIWSGEEHRYINFVEYWGYDLQGAVYQAVEGHMLPFVLAVGTKEAEPNLAALGFSDGDLQAKLAEVEDAAPRYHAIKKGWEEPLSCGHCDWCKAHKKLETIVYYKTFFNDAEGPVERDEVLMHYDGASF